MTGLGNAFTVTDTDADAVHPLVALVTVTEYAVVEDGDILILSLVSVVDHK